MNNTPICTVRYTVNRFVLLTPVVYAIVSCLFWSNHAQYQKQDSIDLQTRHVNYHQLFKYNNNCLLQIITNNSYDILDFV